VRPEPLRLFRVCTAACFVAALSPTWAQSVFKCAVAGQTVYQATPCAGQGKQVELPPGPSTQEVQDAKRRASAEIARANSFQPPAQAGAQNQPKASPADCARLNKLRADAFGYRNGAVRNSRGTNIDQSATVDRLHEQIQRIERQMVAAGCAPT
jgi:hypothetical protein